MLVKAGIVFAILCAVLFVYLVYMGALRSVRIVEREEGPFLFIYREVQGTGQGQIGKVTTELHADLESAGVTTMRPFDLFQPPDSELPNQIGFVIPESDSAKLVSLKGATQRTIPRQLYMATDFPFRNRLSFVVGYVKVNPALAEYRVEKSYRSAYAIARNDGNLITYLQPIRSNERIF
jgi:hypothetical protein